MTGEGDEGNIRNALVALKVNRVAQLFEPLRRGQTVALSVDDPKLLRKKRGYAPMLFITPLTQLGFAAPDRLLVSFPPYGAEVLDVKRDLTTVGLARTGLSMSLAKALAIALNKCFFGGVKHG